MPKRNYKHSMWNRPLPESRRKKNVRMKAKSKYWLLRKHAILHYWAENPDATNWSKEAIKESHDELVEKMRDAGLNHRSPLKFSKAWDKVEGR